MKNIAKAAYCRAFQLGFRVSIPIMPYRNSVILDSMEDVAAVCRKKKIDSVLLVTDKGIQAAGLTDWLLEVLEKADIQCHIYNEVVPNPTTDNVENALKLYKKNNCKGLIGFGGGSSIDCAKAVAARAAKPHQSIQKMGGTIKIRKKLPTIIAIPTTAGTGAETTPTAVITDSKTHHKYTINDFPLIPHYAVLDPETTVGLSKQMTATTGIDALVHAVEAYIGQTVTAESGGYAEEAVKLIYENLEAAYEDGSDLTARRNMLRASYLGGGALSRSYVGYIHAIAHSLGGKYGTPHGLANAVIMPYFLTHYGRLVDEPLARLAKKAGMVPEDTDTRKAAEHFRQWVNYINDKLNIPKHIPEIQIRDIPEMSYYADKEANPLYPVPILMDRKELAAMYYLIKGEAR